MRRIAGTVVGLIAAGLVFGAASPAQAAGPQTSPLSGCCHG